MANEKAHIQAMRRDAVLTAGFLGASVGMILSCLMLVSGVIPVQVSATLITILALLITIASAFLGVQFGRKYWRLLSLDSPQIDTARKPGKMTFTA